MRVKEYKTFIPTHLFNSRVAVESWVEINPARNNFLSSETSRQSLWEQKVLSIHRIDEGLALVMFDHTYKDIDGDPAYDAVLYRYEKLE